MEVVDEHCSDTDVGVSADLLSVVTDFGSVLVATAELVELTGFIIGMSGS